VNQFTISARLLLRADLSQGDTGDPAHRRGAERLDARSGMKRRRSFAQPARRTGLTFVGKHQEPRLVSYETVGQPPWYDGFAVGCQAQNGKRQAQHILSGQA
jgi:hypothetical protein